MLTAPPTLAAALVAPALTISSPPAPLVPLPTYKPTAPDRPPTVDEPEPRVRYPELAETDDPVEYANVPDTLELTPPDVTAM
jgi:hypothetical protein